VTATALREALVSIVTVAALALVAATVALLPARSHAAALEAQSPVPELAPAAVPLALQGPPTAAHPVLRAAPPAAPRARPHFPGVRAGVSASEPVRVPHRPPARLVARVRRVVAGGRRTFVRAADLREGLKTGVTAAAARVAVGLTPLASRSVAGSRVPILLYHQVAETASPAYPLTITPRAFEAQMRWLMSAGYRVISLDEFIAAHRRGRVPRRAVVMTFDDGHRGVFLHAYPILKRYGLPATLFLPTGAVGEPEFPWIRPMLGQGEDPDEYRPLTWDEVRAMDRAIVQLGSHSVTHPHLGKLAEPEIEREVVESRRRIERETGARVTSLSYPGGIGRYGDHSEVTRRVLARTGYAAGLVSEIGRNDASADIYRLRRLSVEASDTLDTFRAKVTGAYSFVRGLQWAAQRVFSDPSHY